MTNSFFDRIRRAVMGPSPEERASAATFGYDLNDPLDLGNGSPFASDKGWKTLDDLDGADREPDGFPRINVARAAEGLPPAPQGDPDFAAAMEALAAFLGGTPSAPEPGEDEPREYFTEDDVTNLGHDLAQIFLQRMIDRAEWAQFETPVEGYEDEPTAADNYRRIARFVLGNMLGVTSERDGEHTHGDDCPACVAVFGPVGGWAEAMRSPGPGPSLNVMPTGVSQVGGDDLSEWDGAFGGAVFGGPPGTPAPGQEGYEGNWRILGHVTEHGFVEADGVNLTPESRARIEASLFDKLGKTPKPFDDDFRRLLGDD